MTDLEIKQLCAEAMGWKHLGQVGVPVPPEDTRDASGLWCMSGGNDWWINPEGYHVCGPCSGIPDPLNDDAQAMALDSVMIDDDHSISFHPRWFARHEYPSGVHTFEFNGAMRDPAQRRRARCECVAMMWLARKGPRRPSTKAKIPTVPYATKLWLALERKDE
jgi:hypothetical protein